MVVARVFDMEGANGSAEDGKEQVGITNGDCCALRPRGHGNKVTNGRFGPAPVVIMAIINLQVESNINNTSSNNKKALLGRCCCLI